MEHQNEYHDSMVAMLELVWGEGFMAPGGVFFERATFGVDRVVGLDPVLWTPRRLV
jgi:hypothetical protein